MLEGRIAETVWGPRLGVRWWRFGAGVLLGLTTAVKWSGAYWIVAFGILTVIWDITARREAGIGYVPEDRTRHGLLASQPLWANRILGYQTRPPVARPGRLGLLVGVAATMQAAMIAVGCYGSEALRSLRRLRETLRVSGLADRFGDRAFSADQAA